METISTCEKIMIYGAQSIALGICRAVKNMFSEKEILGFLVSSKKNNPGILNGLPVIAIDDYSDKYTGKNNVKSDSKDKITVLIAVPESAHGEIIQTLRKYGFFHYICIDWKLEERFMEQYYTQNRQFQSLHKLKVFSRYNGLMQDKLCVFSVKSHKDKNIQKPYEKRKWLSTLQAGGVWADSYAAEYIDDSGDNISVKNGNYCELTALYWIWKNVLGIQEKACEYYGMFQYRRLLNIEDADIVRIIENKVDVILPFPTVHEPDMREHHLRYVRETDWCAMLQALRELEPDYADAFQELLRQPYLYNYNILVARKEVLNNYCSWLFPVLERTEELSCPKGWERNDRYIGYLGENLMTLYFMYHASKLRIVHTGRVMLV